jgi:hypothetical protein
MRIFVVRKVARPLLIHMSTFGGVNRHSQRGVVAARRLDDENFSRCLKIDLHKRKACESRMKRRLSGESRREFCIITTAMLALLRLSLSLYMDLCQRWG